MTEDGTVSILVQPRGYRLRYASNAAHGLEAPAGDVPRRGRPGRLAPRLRRGPLVNPAGLRGTAGRTDGHPPARVHAGAA